MNNILCEYVNKNEYDAGNKARNDVLIISKKLGYNHIPLYKSGASKTMIVIQLIKGCINVVLHTEKNEKILIQYPYYPPIVNRFLFVVLNLGKKIKKYRLELIIHDVIGLRNDKLFTNEGRSVLASEIMAMKIFDDVICHNESMEKVFDGFLPQMNCKILGPFDYLYDGKTIDVEPATPWRIIVAGNLRREKCGYIYELPNLENIRFELYGSEYSGANQNNISYHGSFPPDKLISHLSGHFGLVWDGNSCDTCTGIYGQYLQYNNPHKFSLYLAAGIPVIVWRKSALAKYVEEKGIGICINSLKEMDTILRDFTKNAYYVMKNNVMKIREDIVSGKQLAKVLGD